ncbi:hypothetical protein LINPERPRIM_LOCUS41084 [Linum perenne]
MLDPPNVRVGCGNSQGFLVPMRLLVLRSTEIQSSLIVTLATPLRNTGWLTEIQ